jgi:hypothetical protein
MLDEAGAPINGDGSSIGLGISLGLAATPSFAEEVETEIARRHAHPPHSDSLSDRSPSPDTMNAINEQDPAFARALQGLRMASSEEKETGTEGKKKKQGGKKGKKGRKH